jgi:hypothetical protein
MVAWAGVERLALGLAEEPPSEAGEGVGARGVEFRAQGRRAWGAGHRAQGTGLGIRA